MAGHGRKRGCGHDLEGGAPRRGLVRESPCGLLRERGRFEQKELTRAAASEIEQAADEARGAKRLPLDLLDERPSGVVSRRLVEEEACEAGDARERRVHLVRDACRESAEGGEALPIGQRAFEPRGLGRVIEDEDPGVGIRPGSRKRRHGDVQDPRPRAKVHLELRGRRASDESGGEHVLRMASDERLRAAPQKRRERGVDRGEPPRIVRGGDRGGRARDDVLVKPLEGPIAIGLDPELFEEPRVVEGERRRSEDRFQELRIVERQRHPPGAVAHGEESEEASRNGEGSKRTESGPPEARHGRRRPRREVLPRQACRSQPGRDGKLREKQRRAPVHVAREKRVPRDGKESRARDAEAPRDALPEELLELSERPRRRKLAHERQQPLAVAPGFAILEALKCAGQASPDGREAERHEKSG